MFDVLSNHKIMYCRAHASQEVGAADQLEIDLQEAANGLYERSNTVLLLIEVTNVNSTGTLDIVVEDADIDGTYDADYATIDQITAAGLYYAVLKNIRNSFKLAATVASAAVVWGAIGVGFDATRAPVVQTDGTELDVTYSTGR